MQSFPTTVDETEPSLKPAALAPNVEIVVPTNAIVAPVAPPAEEASIFGTWTYCDDYPGSYEISKESGRLIFKEKAHAAWGELLQGPDWLEGELWSEGGLRQLGRIRVRLEDNCMRSNFMAVGSQNWKSDVLAYPLEATTAVAPAADQTVVPIGNPVVPEASLTKEVLTCGSPAPAKFVAPHGTKCTSFPREYFAAKQRVGVHFFTLPDTRKICFFKDGQPGDPLLIALHGGFESKFKFIQKSPIPGLLLVSIDRPGYGESDPPPKGYTFEMAAEEISGLAKYLGYDEFCVMGHSMGGGWTQQMAAGLKDQVRGAILWSAVCDLTHAKAGPYLRAVGRPPVCIASCLHPRKGCCGCLLRGLFNTTAKQFQNPKYDFRDMLATEMKQGPVAFEKYKVDDFWIASTVDCWRSLKPPALGVVSDMEMWGFAGTHGKPVGHYDVSTIACPMYIVHGDKDYDYGGARAPGAIDCHRAMYPDATFDIMEGVGHILTVGPNEETRDRISKAMANMRPLRGAGTRWSRNGMES